MEEVNPSLSSRPRTLGQLLDADRLEPGGVDGSAEALTDGTSSLVWSEFVERVARIANVLIGADVGPGDRVAIRLSKSVESFVAVHAVLRAGGVVVPIDPLAPSGHAAAVLSDAGATVMIADGRARALEEIAVDSSISHVILPRAVRQDWTPPNGVETVVGADIDATAGADLVEVDPGDPAYIIYTSGSTGRPKGIVHSHRSAIAYASLAAQAYALTGTDRLTNIAPLHVDQSTFELYAAPLVGAAVLVVPDPVLRFPASLSELIEEQRPTVWYSVPYLLDQLSTRGALEQRDLSSLRWVLFGGEVYPPRALARLMGQLPGTRFSNVYGPAEVNQCMIFNLSEPPESDDPVPIGRAWPGARLRVVRPDDLDDHGTTVLPRRVESGEPGVLLVQSDTMMSGYWQRPDLTMGSVIDVPAAHDDPAQRWYATGDLVVERPDGNLVFLGRADNQIKLRGHRIELEAIDAVLRDADHVREATVVVDRPDEGDDRLVAMVVLDPSASDPEATLLATVDATLRQQLPRYAVPADVIVMSSLPRTSTGKVDRAASKALLDA